MSINKIHVNNSTKISLNDRFTVMQKVGPRTGGRRAATTSESGNEVTAQSASFANRKLLEQLEKKHKMLAALKLKRRSLKANLPSRQRIQNRIGLRKGAIKTIRLAPNGKMRRSNSLTNIATMKADLIEPSLRRSNSTSSLAARLGARRLSSGGGKTQPPRRRLRRNSLKQSTARPNLQRSNSIGNLKRSNSKSNLGRSNSKINLNRGDGSVPPLQKTNRKRYRSASRNRSVSSRLGVKRSFGPSGNRTNRMTTNNNSRKRLSQVGVARGRITKRRNSTGNLPIGNKGRAQQGRVSRPRGRGRSIQGQGNNRSRSTSRVNKNIVPRSRSRQRISGRGGGAGAGGGRMRGRGRGRVQRSDIKKEDLDKELDQYMANTKTALDNEMDVFMNN